jgi:hypothetical protein
MFEIYLTDSMINVTLDIQGHDAMLSGRWLPRLWRNLPSSSKYYFYIEDGGSRFVRKCW